MNIIDPNWTLGPDAAQGDLLLTCLSRLCPKIAKTLDRSSPIKSSSDGELRLLDGELTGHHHSIYGRGVVMFRDDGLARDLAKATTVPADEFGSGAATLYRDPKLMAALIEAGHFTRADLLVGFLVVDGSVVVRHQEHDGIRLPAGVYYIGRQIESVGAEERRVAD